MTEELPIESVEKLKRIAAFAPIGIAGAVLMAFVLAAMWGWFVVPLGLPAISTVHALGLRGVSRLLVTRWAEDGKSAEHLADLFADRGWGDYAIDRLGAPLALLLLGWLLHLGMA